MLEFNVRMGDPETQPLMMRLESDWAEALMAAARGSLSAGRAAMVAGTRNMRRHGGGWISGHIRKPARRSRVWIR